MVIEVIDGDRGNDDWACKWVMVILGDDSC